MRLINKGAICQANAREQARLLKWQKAQERKRKKTETKANKYQKGGIHGA